LIKDIEYIQDGIFGVILWNYKRKIDCDLKFGNVIAEGRYFKPDLRLVLDYEQDFNLLKNIINYFNRI
jgi:spore coat polysaccharide biosynthesis protein SpsF (cytidylyltransferase family)